MIQHVQRRGVAPIAVAGPGHQWRTHLRMRADSREQRALAGALTDLAREQGWAARPRFLSQLLLEELATNAIRHGGASWVELHVADDGAQVRLELIDDGAAYDPMVADPSDGPIADLDREGGLGLALLRGLAGPLHYVRRDGRNHTHALIGLSGDCLPDHGN